MYIGIRFGGAMVVDAFFIIKKPSYYISNTIIIEINNNCFLKNKSIKKLSEQFHYNNTFVNIDVKF